MTKRLSQKSALVTGGGSGIGKSICHRLAQEGAQVVVVDISAQSAEESAAEINAQGGNAIAIECDMASSQDVKDKFAQILANNSLDILINNAGIAHIGNLENTTEDDLDRLYQVNIKGVYNSLSAVIPAMKAQRSGVIINMASVAAMVSVADRFAYSMTKGAVLTMTYSVAKDYLNDGIRCNCISPGRVHTPFVDNFLEQNYPHNRDEMYEKLAKSQPIGRMATPDEVAALVAYLCSDDAAFITGTNVPIDGGFVNLNN